MYDAAEIVLSTAPRSRERPFIFCEAVVIRR